MEQQNDFALGCNWRTVLKDLGIEPSVVLRRAGLPLDLLSRPDTRVSTETYFRFWEALEHAADDPLFPIRLVQNASAESFMPPVFAAMCSPNLEIALQRLSTYKRLIAPVRLQVDQQPDSVTMSMEWLDATVVPPASLLAVDIVFTVHLARTATREHIEPLNVVSSQRLHPASAYRDYLGVEVQEGQHLAMTFARTDAERPFLTANDFTWQAFEPGFRRQLARLEESRSVPERVRAALFEALPVGQSSTASVARRLSMSKRTLQRRLSDAGTTFQALLNATREELARHYLSNTSLSCKEISFLLGFEEPTSFYRAFNDWTGHTPEHHRQLMRS